ncbi:SRPBCC domain-containing protein [Herbiconiux sp. CPCC 205716]|uniref:SRPBCC domain-containing protein n=1 Tax=Herbiconiux gentiana TaxID=2970912 RepID=A0ABT2GG08_9MICO|nr:SRPBCC domain-containing protein [Herbiconiux gentiana]MCS5715166.1 SRPBCC domain-containing protein [Herbiconiux gentiana]
MSTNVRYINASPEQVFDVLADGWLFPVWVVGASRMREVADDWPRVGSKLHHSFGVWPAVIDDETTVLEWDPPRHMVIQPAGWPIGEARVTIDVKPRGDGALVRIRERAVKGPGAFVPSLVLDVPLYVRNVETLRRLAWIAENRPQNDSTESRTRTPGAVDEGAAGPVGG